MNVSGYYEEVSNYVEMHFSVRPSIKPVDDKTLSIEYFSHKFIPAISVATRIAALRKDIVCLHECMSRECYRIKECSLVPLLVRSTFFRIWHGDYIGLK